MVFRHDVKKMDYLKLRPTSSSADNKTQSGEILFQIAQASSCLNICDSLLYFTVEIRGLEPDEELTLEHNFFPKLFSQMRLNLGGMDVEIINNPCDVFTIVLYSM